MEILKLLIFAFPFILALTVLVHAQSQTGFISIDCGLAENSAYTDKKTGIHYKSDVNFTEAGESHNIASEYNKDTLEQPFLTVRSFPEGIKNCYTLKPTLGDIKFLIRASFMYGNYDGKNKSPSFDLLLGAEVWDSVELADASTIVSKEIIHVPQKNYVHVCLANNGSGTPFISSLELRPIANDSYPTKLGTSLLLHSRFDIGSTSNKTYRFKDDAFDRIWSPYTKSNWLTINSSLKLFDFIETTYQLPTAVMQTAAVPANANDSLVIKWKFSDPTLKFFAYIHVAELDQSQAKSQKREQDTYLNGDYLWNGPTTPPYLSPFTLYSSRSISGREKLEFSINKSEGSPLPPILNAIELYQLKQFQQYLTDQDDVDAIMNIKATYGLKINWQGDPCAPVKYSWQGLNCSYPEYNSPRITSLNLSSSGISGKISPYISSLTLIESLDLSYNNLTGPVPDFLTKLPLLTVLNLTGNNLQGSIPVGLRENGKYGNLSLRADGNPDLCLSTSCTRNIVVPLLASFLAVSVLIAALSIMWIRKTRSQGITWNKNKRSLELNRRFSYSDVVRITDDFKRIIGQGGFGTVYHGNLDDRQVAVKMLSLSSIQGDKEFQTEVELLLRVHHKNLTTLIGYCDDGRNKGLIYEFMANGNLESHLSDEGSSTADILSWEGRLQIAIEAAQGLDYLHSGCKPPIVHRDVKPTNILLNEKFQAKISDFGLSRIFPIEGDTHLSTTVAGTPGYLDPEYYISNRLTEKSDMYSFGVVLLQLITSKPAIEKSNDRTHIIQWVSFMLAKGDIKNVADPRLQGDLNMDSVSKAIKVAMACVSQNSAERPTMNQVVINLNESLAIEIARTKARHETESKSSIETESKSSNETESKSPIENISSSMNSGLPPIARYCFVFVSYFNTCI